MSGGWGGLQSHFHVNPNLGYVRLMLSGVVIELCFDKTSEIFLDRYTDKLSDIEMSNRLSDKLSLSVLELPIKATI